MNFLGLIMLSAILPSQSFHSSLKLKNVPSAHLHMTQHQFETGVKAIKRRPPANKRQAIKWVVQGVERCLAEQQLPAPPNNSRTRFRNYERVYTYKRREDASLVDALYLLVNAKNQKEVIDAGKRIEVLMRVGRGRQDFPVEVSERVIKACASTGLLALSMDLLRQMLSDGVLPSPMAYTAVINALRKSGRVSQVEELLVELGNSCRRINQQMREERQSDENFFGVDIVAFNSFIAAICDAAVKATPYTMTTSTEVVDAVDKNYDQRTLEVSNSTQLKSSTEKHLYKALCLVKADTALKKFELLGEPDIYSYNAILSAAAKCSRSTESTVFFEHIVSVCLEEMNNRGIKPDVFTYNARIEIALEAKSSNVVQLIDEAMAWVKVDRYTINLALVPLLKRSRHHDVMSMLKIFYRSNSSNNKMVASAFEAFMNTLVQNSEVEFARKVFQEFFLSTSVDQEEKSVNRYQLSQERINEAMNIQHITPTTRHFNILFSGYSKLYWPKRSYNQANQNSDNKLNASRDRSISVAQTVYSLLDDMLRIGVPLDKFSVSSLMTFPTTSESVTLLWKRIEPELSTNLSPAAYRAIITAYGNAFDPSSACWVFFGEMRKACDRRGMTVDSWNVLLGAIARGTGDNTQLSLEPLSSPAARRHGVRNISNAKYVDSHQIFSLVDGKTCADASLSILGAMRNQTAFMTDSQMWVAPKPNSQTYCQVAKAQSSTSKSNSVIANTLFNFAKENYAHIDGRFLNAVLRCYGDDLDSALKAWKTGVASAAVGTVFGFGKEQSDIKRSANLAAAYNGLIYVSGRALKPDVALRLCYAMKKAGVEANEVSLNSYYSGKRVAMNGKENKRELGFKSQFESLLTVECLKYSSKDKRRVGEKKIRIILS